MERLTDTFEAVETFRLALGEKSHPCISSEMFSRKGAIVSLGEIALVTIEMRTQITQGAEEINYR